MSSTHARLRRFSADALLQRAFVVELGLVCTLLIGFYAYTVALAAVLDPYFLDSDTSLLVVRSALLLVGLGALARSYAVWRGYALRVSVPRRADAPLVGGAVVGAALLATLPFSLLALQTGTGVTHVVSTLTDVGGAFSTRTLIRLSLFVPGMALLYHGLVQGALGHAFADDGPLAVVTTTLLGGYLVAPMTVTYGTFATGPWLSLWGSRAVVAVLFVLTLGLAAVADDRVDDDWLHALTRLPALAALTLAALVVAAAADSTGGVLVTVTRTAVLGLAAVTYERSDSLGGPLLVYATFAVVSHVLYTATVAATFGG